MAEIALSFAEFVGVVAGFILIIVLIAIIIIEYRNWRLRREAKKLIVRVNR